MTRYPIEPEIDTEIDHSDRLRRARAGAAIRELYLGGVYRGAFARDLPDPKMIEMLNHPARATKGSLA